MSKVNPTLLEHIGEGWRNVAGSAAHTLGLASRESGYNDLSQTLLDYDKSLQEKSLYNRPGYTPLEATDVLDNPTLDNTVEYAKQMGGQQIPILLSMLLSGKVGGRVQGKFNRKPITKTDGSPLGFDPNNSVGTTLGAGVPIQPMAVSEQYNQIMSDNPNEDPSKAFNTSLLAGTAQAASEMLPYKRLFGGKTSSPRSVPRAIGETAIGEAAQEAGVGLSRRAVSSVMAADHGIDVDIINKKDMINEGIGGATVSLLFGPLTGYQQASINRHARNLKAELDQAGVDKKTSDKWVSKYTSVMGSNRPDTSPESSSTPVSDLMYENDMDLVGARNFEISERGLAAVSQTPEYMYIRDQALQNTQDTNFDEDAFLTKYATYVAERAANKISEGRSSDLNEAERSVLDNLPDLLYDVLGRTFRESVRDVAKKESIDDDVLNNLQEGELDSLYEDTDSLTNLVSQIDRELGGDGGLLIRPERQEEVYQALQYGLDNLSTPDDKMTPTQVGIRDIVRETVLAGLKDPVRDQSVTKLDNPPSNNDPEYEYEGGNYTNDPSIVTYPQTGTGGLSREDIGGLPKVESDPTTDSINTEPTYRDDTDAPTFDYEQTGKVAQEFTDKRTTALGNFTFSKNNTLFGNKKTAEVARGVIQQSEKVGEPHKMAEGHEVVPASDVAFELDLPTEQIIESLVESKPESTLRNMKMFLSVSKDNMSLPPQLRNLAEHITETKKVFKNKTGTSEGVDYDFAPNTPVGIKRTVKSLANMWDYILSKGKMDVALNKSRTQSFFTNIFKSSNFDKDGTFREEAGKALSDMPASEEQRESIKKYANSLRVFNKFLLDNVYTAVRRSDVLRSVNADNPKQFIDKYITTKNESKDTEDTSSVRLDISVPSKTDPRKRVDKVFKYSQALRQYGRSYPKDTSEERAHRVLVDLLLAYNPPDTKSDITNISEVVDGSKDNIIINHYGNLTSLKDVLEYHRDIPKGDMPEFEGNTNLEQLYEFLYVEDPLESETDIVGGVRQEKIDDKDKIVENTRRDTAIEKRQASKQQSLEKRKDTLQKTIKNIAKRAIGVVKDKFKKDPDKTTEDINKQAIVINASASAIEQATLNNMLFLLDTKQLVEDISAINILNFSFGNINKRQTSGDNNTEQNPFNEKYAKLVQLRDDLDALTYAGMATKGEREAYFNKFREFEAAVASYNKVLGKQDRAAYFDRRTGELKLLAPRERGSLHKDTDRLIVDQRSKTNRDSSEVIGKTITKGKEENSVLEPSPISGYKGQDEVTSALEIFTAEGIDILNPAIARIYKKFIGTNSGAVLTSNYKELVEYKKALSFYSELQRPLPSPTIDGVKKDHVRILEDIAAKNKEIAQLLKTSGKDKKHVNELREERGVLLDLKNRLDDIIRGRNVISRYKDKFGGLSLKRASSNVPSEADLSKAQKTINKLKKTADGDKLAGLKILQKRLDIVTSQVKSYTSNIKTTDTASDIGKVLIKNYNSAVESILSDPTLGYTQRLKELGGNKLKKIMGDVQAGDIKSMGVEGFSPHQSLLFDLKNINFGVRPDLREVRRIQRSISRFKETPTKYVEGGILDDILVDIVEDLDVGISTLKYDSLPIETGYLLTKIANDLAGEAGVNVLRREAYRLHRDKNKSDVLASPPESAIEMYIDSALRNTVKKASKNKENAASIRRYEDIISGKYKPFVDTEARSAPVIVGALRETIGSIHSFQKRIPSDPNEILPASTLEEYLGKVHETVLNDAMSQLVQNRETTTESEHNSRALRAAVKRVYDFVLGETVAKSIKGLTYSKQSDLTLLGRLAPNELRTIHRDMIAKRRVVHRKYGNNVWLVHKLLDQNVFWGIQKDIDEGMVGSSLAVATKARMNESLDEKIALAKKLNNAKTINEFQTIEKELSEEVGGLAYLLPGLVLPNISSFNEHYDSVDVSDLYEKGKNLRNIIHSAYSVSNLAELKIGRFSELLNSKSEEVRHPALSFEDNPFVDNLRTIFNNPTPIERKFLRGVLNIKGINPNSVLNKKGKKKTHNMRIINNGSKRHTISKADGDRVAKVINGWLKVLRMDDLSKKIKVVVSKNVKNNALASAITTTDGKYIISINASQIGETRSIPRLMELAAHELGHIIESEFIDGELKAAVGASTPGGVKVREEAIAKMAGMNAKQRRKQPLVMQLLYAHDQWLQERGGIENYTYSQLVEDALPFNLAKMAVGKNKGRAVNRNSKYYKYQVSFGEWFANETSKYLTTKPQTRDVIGVFFREIAQLLKRLFTIVSGKSGAYAKQKPNDIVKKYFDARLNKELWKNEPFDVGSQTPPLQLPEREYKILVADAVRRFNVGKKTPINKKELSDFLKYVPMSVWGYTASPEITNRTTFINTISKYKKIYSGNKNIVHDTPAHVDIATMDKIVDIFRKHTSKEFTIDEIREIMQGSLDTDAFWMSYDTTVQPLSAGARAAMYYALTNDGFFTTKERNIVGRAVSKGTVMKQLRALLDKEPTLLSRLDDDPFLAASYAYQFWLAGEISLGTKTKTIFSKFVDLMKRVFGVISDSDNAVALFKMFERGKVAQRGKGQNDFTITTRLGKTYAQKMFIRAERMFEPLQNAFGVVFSTTTNDTFNTKNPWLRALANKIGSHTIRTTNKESYIDAKNRKASEFYNEAVHIFKDYFGKEFGGKLSTDQQEETYNLAKGLKPAVGSKQKRFVARIRTYFKNLYSYGSTGENMSNSSQQGIPIVFDIEYLERNQDKFYKKLRDRHDPHIVDTVGHDRANVYAGEFLDHILDTGGTGIPDPTERGFGKFFSVLDLKVFDEFVNKDLLEAVGIYTHRTVINVEFSKRFSSKSVAKYLEEARRSGASANDLARADGLVQSALGKYNKDTISPRLNTIQDWLIVLQNFAILGMSTITSTADLLGVGIRSDLKTLMKSTYSVMLKDISNAVDDNSKYDTYKFSEFVGTVGDMTTNSVVSSQYGAPMSKSATAANNFFFNAIQLTRWTNFTRKIATEAAINFIETQSGIYLSATESDSKRVHAKNMLEELEILDYATDSVVPKLMTLSDREGLKDKIKNTKDKKIRQQLIRKGTTDDKLRSAIHRFVNSSIIRPDPTQIPLWGNDPRFKLVIHLKSFMFGFQEKILSRIGYQLYNGNLTPMFNAALLFPAVVAAMLTKQLIRDMASGEEEDYLDELEEVRLLSVTDKSGLLGVSSVLFNVINAPNYGDHGIGDIFGATAGGVIQTISDGNLSRWYPGYSIMRY